MIAHRLSTIRDSDLILVLDHGRILERGTHDELLALEAATRGSSSATPSSPSEAATPDRPLSHLIHRLTHCRLLHHRDQSGRRRPFRGNEAVPEFRGGFFVVREKEARMSPAELTVAIDTVWVIVAACMVF